MLDELADALRHVAARGVELVRSERFVAGGRDFVVESNEPGLIRSLERQLHDLRSPVEVAPNGDVEADDHETTVFTVLRAGPAWLTHPWALWRDGEPCETTLSHGYVEPYVLWEVTRLVLEGATMPVVPMHAAAVVHRGRAVALIGRSHSGKSTLSAWLTHRGWGFLTDEVALLDTTDPEHPVVRPFWRPIGVRLGGPVDHLVDVADAGPEALVPASELGALAGPTPLAALICPTHVPGTQGELEPLTPAAALTMISGQLPNLRSAGAAAFHALAAVVERVPAFTLLVDDLDVAERTMADRLDAIAAGGDRPAAEPSVAELDAETSRP